MDRSMLEREFRKSKKISLEEQEKHHRQLVQKLLEHKYGGHRKEGKENNDRER